MTTENPNNIYETLNAIQNELIAPKGRVQNNFNYRNCEDIMNGIKPLLLKYKCILLLDDEVIMVGQSLFIKAQATIMNLKGEKITATSNAEIPEKLMAMSKSQITGSTSSYARKYALNGLLCLDDSRDADVEDREKKASGFITESEKQKLGMLVSNMGYERKLAYEYLDVVYGFKKTSEITSDKLAAINEDFSKGTIEEKIAEAKNATQS